MIQKNKEYFLNGEYFKWECTDQYGWGIKEDKIREFTINNILNVQEIPNGVTLLLTLKKLPFSYGDDSWIDITYENDILKFKGTKFAMELKDTYEFIKKLITDNNWEIPSKHLI